MKWVESISSNCRYGDVASRIFNDAEIIWENSYDEYQGSVKLIALLKNSNIVTFTYDYGSCSGCDEWEGLGLNNDQIEQVMRQECMEEFKDYNEFLDYFKSVNLYKDVSEENLLRLLVVLGEKGWLRE